MELSTIDKIKEIVEAEGLSRYRLSQITGIPSSLLVHYWKGTTSPNIANIEKIVNALGYEIKLVKKEK